MRTVTDQSAQVTTAAGPCGCCPDCPHCPARRPLTDPRAAAAFFTAFGISPASLRQEGAHVPAGVADAMDALAAEGLDQDACRELLGLETLPDGGAL